MSLKTAIFLVLFLLIAPGLSGALAQDPAAPAGNEVHSLEDVDLPLRDVLRQAWQDNPTLRAARAELEAVREALPQAQTGYKPVITANGEISYVDTESKGTSFTTQDGPSTAKQGSLDVTQPLFRGGRTFSAIRGARNRIAAQEYILKATEQQALYDAAAAYMDVVRDRALLNLSENNRALIERQLEATRDRFNVGELTRTDVSQAQARLAGAQAEITAAKGDLRSSMAVFEQLIGVLPDEKLPYPAIDFSFPPDLDEALSAAAMQNPSVIASEYMNAAAEDNVDTVFGELLPEVSLNGALTKSYDPHPGFLEEQDTQAVGVSVSIPLYEAGGVRSRVREAKHTANQRFMEIMEIRRAVRAQTIASWEDLAAAVAEIDSREAQIEAAAVAQEGVRYETEFGERTILDALDADQEYLDAQVGLVLARRNDVLARFSLAQALGILTPENLGLFPQETASVTPPPVTSSE